jgi:hypothetical protein
MYARMETVENTVKKRLEDMIKNAKSGRAFIQMQVYPRYLEHQKLRWQTENWGLWDALNPGYAEYKKKKFADKKGQGMRMMIATGRLIDAVLGESNLHRKIVTEKSLVVGVGGTEPGGELEYAPRANLMRPFMSFDSTMDQRFKKEIRALYRKWMVK